MEELVTTINTFSSSHGAQMLVRHLGLATAGTGTVEAGIAAVVEHLTRSGLPMDNVVVADATGLSENNRVTCRLIFELLRNAGPDSVLARSLWVSGTIGTAGQRFTNPEIRGLVRAKTGTLSQSRALAGFATSWVDGRHIPFVFIINQDGLDYDTFDPLARLIQEDLLVALVQLPCLPDRDAFEKLVGAGDQPSTVLALGDVAGPADGDPTTDSITTDLMTTDSTAVDPLAPTIEPADPGDLALGDPRRAGCDDGQPVHGLRLDSTFVELRYSPSCETMWAKATFASLISGVAELHLVGYQCAEAESACRAAVQTVRLDSGQVCTNPVDESGTCVLASADQVLTEMMPASMANLRACLSLRPTYGASGVSPDVCTDPAYQPVLSGGPTRQLARTTSECRVIRETTIPTVGG